MADVPSALTATGWTADATGQAIEKTFRFGNFRDAIAWMVRAAFEAEDCNHHPEWSNVYSRVSVRLTTHDIGGLTDRDFALAERMAALSTGL